MQQENIDKLQKDLEQANKLAEERLNSWKRAAADFENYKKRREKEDAALLGFTKELVIMRLLPVLESLEQALGQAPSDERYKVWKEGIDKVGRQLEEAMAELGVERIKTVGTAFSHELHEAVEMVEGGKSGEIVEEVAAGYKVNGHVVRPAKVKVAR